MASPAKPTDSIHDLISEARRIHDHARAVVEAEIAKDKPHLKVQSKGGLTTFLSKSLDRPDGLRVTTFRGSEPVGHREYVRTAESLKLVVSDMVAGGLRPPPTPAAAVKPRGKVGLALALMSVAASAAGILASGRAEAKPSGDTYQRTRVDPRSGKSITETVRKGAK